MNTEYSITICTFQIQNIEMALKSTSSIEDIEMWHLYKTLERLEKIQTWKNLNLLSVELKDNKAPWKKERTRIINFVRFLTKNKKAAPRRPSCAV